MRSTPPSIRPLVRLDLFPPGAAHEASAALPSRGFQERTIPRFLLSQRKLHLQPPRG